MKKIEAVNEMSVVVGDGKEKEEEEEGEAHE